MYSLKCLAQNKILAAMLIIEDVTQGDFEVMAFQAQELRIFGNPELPPNAVATSHMWLWGI